MVANTDASTDGSLVSSFARTVVFRQVEARRKRYAGLIALFLGDMERSQALMLAFRTFRQRGELASVPFRCSVPFRFGPLFRSGFPFAVSYPSSSSRRYMVEQALARRFSGLLRKSSVVRLCLHWVGRKFALLLKKNVKARILPRFPFTASLDSYQRWLLIGKKEGAERCLRLVRQSLCPFSVHQ
jgi:hypothetical protein